MPLQRKAATALLLVVAIIAATLSTLTVSAQPAQATAPHWTIDTYGTPQASDNVILKWDEQLLGVIRRNPGATGPTRTARAIGILHTATYDAWAAYDADADGTRLLGQLRRPANERTLDNKSRAISYAAYRVLSTMFPGEESHFKAQMSALGYPINMTSMDTTPAGIGNQAAQAVLDFRSTDGSTATSSYQPVNTWESVGFPGRWQPLCVPLVPAGQPCPSTSTIQKPLTPQWGWITPFALNPATGYPNQFELPGITLAADGSIDPAEVDLVLRETSSLTDSQKVRAEYWADGPQTEFPPGHTMVFAQALSRKRKNTLDQDAKLFFALGNALMDASISAWRGKYQYDSARPISAIRERYKDKKINSWLGPYKGWGRVPGQQWMPYQATDVVTPPFPEYVSGHSTFTAAGRTVLLAFYGTDDFNVRVTIPAGSSKIEPGLTPAKDIVLSWKTLSAAADDAGMSRRWGGIHFEMGDEHGRTLGRVAGYDVWVKAQTYFDGSATKPT